MELSEFLGLSEWEKTNVIQQDSTYLISRHLEGINIHLYVLFDFYAEVWMDPKYHIRLKIHAFDNVEGLDPYLDLIYLK